MMVGCDYSFWLQWLYIHVCIQFHCSENSVDQILFPQTIGFSHLHLPVLEGNRASCVRHELFSMFSIILMLEISSRPKANCQDLIVIPPMIMIRLEKRFLWKWSRSDQDFSENMEPKLHLQFWCSFDAILPCSVPRTPKRFVLFWCTGGVPFLTGEFSRSDGTFWVVTMGRPKRPVRKKVEKLMKTDELVIKYGINISKTCW